jgi:hypothetical protein
MDLDMDRWHRLRLAAANAAHDGPDFTAVQDSADRRARARAKLAAFKAAGARGYASGPPIANAHAGETIEPGVGGHSPDDVKKAFERSVAELEARVAVAEREADRLAERLRECNARRGALSRLVDSVQEWAKAQNPPLTLPGDDGRFVPPPGIVGARRHA